MLGSDVHFIVHGLDKRRLSPLEAVEFPALSYVAARYAIWRVFQIVQPLRLVLEDATDRVLKLDHARGSPTPTVPFMAEFLQFAWTDKRTVLRKKAWP